MEIIVKGKATSVRFGTTKGDDKERYRVSLDCTNINDFIDEAIKAYEGCHLKPKYLDGKTTHINITSRFDYPCLFENRKLMLSDFIADGRVVDSDVTIKCNLKEDGALYPIAMIVNTMGSEYDPFDF